MTEPERIERNRVVVYARVNGPPADQARALALQWERMRRFVLDHAGWMIVGEFSDITTRRSAKVLPGLCQAVAAATAGVRLWSAADIRDAPGEYEPICRHREPTPRGPRGRR